MIKQILLLMLLNNIQNPIPASTIFKFSKDEEADVPCHLPFPYRLQCLIDVRFVPSWEAENTLKHRAKGWALIQYVDEDISTHAVGTVYIYISPSVWSEFYKNLHKKL